MAGSWLVSHQTKSNPVPRCRRAKLGDFISLPILIGELNAALAYKLCSRVKLLDSFGNGLAEVLLQLFPAWITQPFPVICGAILLSAVSAS